MSAEANILTTGGPSHCPTLVLENKNALCVLVTYSRPDYTQLFLLQISSTSCQECDWSAGPDLPGDEAHGPAWSPSQASPYPTPPRPPSHLPLQLRPCTKVVDYR